MNTGAVGLFTTSKLPGDGSIGRQDNAIASGPERLDDANLTALANREPTVAKYRLDPARAATIRTAPPVVIDLKEARAYLVCSPRKLRDLIACRRVKSARVGAKIVIRRVWLDAFLGDPV